MLSLNVQITTQPLHCEKCNTIVDGRDYYQYICSVTNWMSLLASLKGVTSIIWFSPLSVFCRYVLSWPKLFILLAELLALYSTIQSKKLCQILQSWKSWNPKRENTTVVCKYFSYYKTNRFMLISIKCFNEYILAFI